MKPARPFLFVFVLLTIVSLACSFGGSAPANTPAPVEKPTEEKATEAPKATPTPESKAIKALDDLRNAVIQIEATGTFVEPQGTVVNADWGGSGFLIDPSGIAVTNNHVVTGAATLKAILNGETYRARVLGASECADLAVIQLEGGDFPYLDWYADAPKTGMEVYSAGFPLREPEFTLTKGIISKEKADGQTSWASLDYTLSHDATINPGNSGGPLVNKDAQVVGVNYASRSQFNQYFAIDAKTARKFVEDLKNGKDVLSIGINGTAFALEDGSLSGIWVSSVKSGSPADKTGIKPGDILYQMENLVLATDGTMKSYCDILRSRSATDTIGITVIRFGTGELLEGQLNGRELKVTGNFNTGGGSSGGGSTSSGEAPAFFVEEFDGKTSLDNWSYFVLGSGNRDKVSFQVKTDSFLVDIQDLNVYAYFFYEPYTYTNVRISMRAENLGRNNNNVSLICRYNPERNQWYEFSTEGGGVWYLYAYDNGNYNVIAQGGAKALRQGKEVNDYEMICRDREITLIINGQEVRRINENKFVFKEGQVGFNISSLNVLPITVDVYWFSIAEP
ncbi:MAG: trypsin-like peptidase domain-containing protein [Anaerolineales bacterium]|nr:trypsin-like peptidase domain-containing protein [Anaerolineales bacterium]MCX7756281.1 trypsin-like peptidase domain-containing protein [Anaerolineales bacterium]MDW8276637.1 trypsin-like peptidase domain-containing protein [Anaerolineales bacterium]